MKSIIKRGVALMLCVTIGWQMPAVVYATEQELQNTKQKINELEQEKQKADSTTNALKKEKDKEKADVDTLNASISDISDELVEIENEMADAQETITKQEQELKQTKKDAAEQYELMKQRMQYMYEQGSESFLIVLLQSESLTDLINRAEYVEAISSYDKEKQEEYLKLCNKIEKSQNELKQRQKTLLALQEDAEEKRTQMKEFLTGEQAELQLAENELDAAQSVSDAYAARIAEQKAYEARLEEQKAREDAARMDEIKEQEQENLDHSSVTVQNGDLQLLAALIQCEAEGEPYEGKLAVGSVVMNRVASSYFPNTVVGVIYQSKQFSPVASGRLATVLAQGANATCTQAAQEVLNGKRTIGALYFRRNNGIIQGTVIGNHVFY